MLLRACVLVVWLCFVRIVAVSLDLFSCVWFALILLVCGLVTQLSPICVLVGSLPSAVVLLPACIFTVTLGLVCGMVILMG